MNLFNEENQQNLNELVIALKQEGEKISNLKQSHIGKNQYEIAARYRCAEITLHSLIYQLKNVELGYTSFEAIQKLLQTNEKYPNLFRNAKKELSQDGFFTWFFEWANTKYEQVDQELHIAAKSFINKLIQLKYSNDVVVFNKVSIERQWKGRIDIRIEVNGEYEIIIEDKINCLENANQLDEYKSLLDNIGERDKKSVLIYLKTGNESRKSLNEITAKGWIVFSRRSILDALMECKSINNIFVDFYSNLSDIEELSRSYQYRGNTIENIRTAEGFYIALQEKLEERGIGSDWKYVPNKRGGFLGLWYFFEPVDSYKLYIQIENYLNGKINFTIRVQELQQPTVGKLYMIFEQLQRVATKRDIILSKPNRYKIGKSSTVAIIETNSLLVRGFDIDKFDYVLRNLETIIRDSQAQLT